MQAFIHPDHAVNTFIRLCHRQHAYFFKAKIGTEKLIFIGSDISNHFFVKGRPVKIASPDRHGRPVGLQKKVYLFGCIFHFNPEAKSTVRDHVKIKVLFLAVIPFVYPNPPA